MTGVSFAVQGDPQGKGRPRATTRGGHASLYTPAKTLAYEGLIAHAAQQAMAGAAPVDHACLVQMHITVAVPASWSKKRQAAALAGQVMPTKKPDTDNVVKAVFDGMNGVVWRDDVQAVDLFVRVTRCGEAA